MTQYTAPVILTASTNNPDDYELAISLYTANKAGTGFAQNQRLQRVAYVNTNGTVNPPPDRWLNLDTGVTLTTPPNFTDINPVDYSGLTQAQLTATLAAATLKVIDDPTSPTTASIGKIDDAPAAEDATGNGTVISWLKRLAKLGVDILAKIPSVTLVNGAMPITSTDKAWRTVEFKVDADGFVTFEKETDGVTIRARSWIRATDVNGIVTITAGAWA